MREFQEGERSPRTNQQAVREIDTKLLEIKEIKKSVGFVDVIEEKNGYGCPNPVETHMTMFTVRLPDGKETHIAIDKRTPMMDVLVQVTTKYGLSAGGKVLKVPTDRPPGYLHYKPNMPIGVLGCTTLEVVSKHSVVNDRPLCVAKKMSSLAFEQLLRVQVDLPRKRKTVFRVRPQTSLSEILRRACDEGDLGSSHGYELHGAQAGHGYPLNLDLRLADVGTVDFAVVESQTMRNAQGISFGNFSEGIRVEKKKDGCFKNLFNRKKHRTVKPPSDRGSLPTLPRQSGITGNGWSVSTLTSYRTEAPSEYEIPSEPSHPPPTLPPSTVSSRKKRPAPAPPSSTHSLSVHDCHNVNRLSSSSSGYRSSVQPPSPNLSTKYEEIGGLRPHSRNVASSDKSLHTYNFLSVTPTSSIRTVASSRATSSRPESMRSEAAKKRKAPPPPCMPGAGSQNTAVFNQQKRHSSPAIYQNGSQSQSAMTEDGRWSSRDLTALSSRIGSGSTVSVSKHSSQEVNSHATPTAIMSDIHGPAQNMQTVQDKAEISVPEITVACMCNSRNCDTAPKVGSSMEITTEQSAPSLAKPPPDLNYDALTITQEAVSDSSPPTESKASEEVSRNSKQLEQKDTTDPIYVNATCQTDLALGPLTPVANIALGNSPQEAPLSPQSRIVYKESKGDLFQPRTQIKSFEDEYYSRSVSGDYERMIRYGPIEEQAKALDRVKNQHGQKDKDSNNVAKFDQNASSGGNRGYQEHSAAVGKLPVTKQQAPATASKKNAAAAKQTLPPISPRPLITPKPPASATVGQATPKGESRAQNGIVRAQIQLMNVMAKKNEALSSGANVRDPKRTIAAKNQVQSNGASNMSIQKRKLGNMCDHKSPPIFMPPAVPPFLPVAVVKAAITVPPPPPPPLPAIASRQQDHAMISHLDGRADLMEAIRNFGGAERLKKVK